MLQISDDPYKLELRGAKQEELDKALCCMVEEAVLACTERDQGLRSLRLQLEGWSQPNTNQPWPGACEVEDTISRELHTTLTAAIWSAAKQKPYVCLEPVNRDDVDRASDVETWMNIKAEMFGYDKALYNAIYLALESRYAPMYIGYRQDVIRSFQLKDQVVLEGEEQPEPELELKEVPGEESIEFRAVDPWDFYVWPITAEGPQVAPPQSCSAVIERMCLTQEDLMRGVLHNGYDEDAVRKMLVLGPIAYDYDKMETDWNRDGLGTSSVRTTNSGGTWECFQVIGRSPLLEDEDKKPTIPDALLHTDCMWMVCPGHKIVFKQSYSPFPNSIRPYAIYHAVKKPNRLLGEGLVSLISQIQDELTSVVRFGINNMNLEASPCMVVAESWFQRYAKWTIAPGRNIPRPASDPIGPKPLTWDTKSQGLVISWREYLVAQGHRLAASESVNSGLAGKSRKAAEIHFAEEMQQTKFGLFLSNIQAGVEETFRIMMLIMLQHMKQDGRTDTANANGQEIVVDPDDLEKKFRFLPQASSDSVSPASRLARQQAIAGIVMQYWQVTMQMPQIQGYMWALHHRLLVLAGERNPERFIGPDPNQSEQQGGSMPMLPMMGMAGAGGGGMPNAMTNNGAGLLQASPFTPHANGAG